MKLNGLFNSLIVSCLFGTVIVYSSGSLADQYDHCNQILAKGIYDKFRSSYESVDVQIFKQWFCSSETGKDKSKMSFGLTIPIKGIPVSLSGSDDEMNEWKNQYCSDEDKSYYGSRSSHIMLDRVNENVVKAWEKCIQTDPESNGLLCSARETEDGLFLTVKLRYGMKDLSSIDISHSNLEPIGKSIENFTQLSGGGSKVLHFEIKDKNKEARFTLNGSGLGVDLVCNYVVPKKFIRKKCDELREAAYNFGLITYEQLIIYKEHDMIPLTKDGKFVGIYACDEE